MAARNVIPLRIAHRRICRPFEMYVYQRWVQVKNVPGTPVEFDTTALDKKNRPLKTQKKYRGVVANRTISDAYLPLKTEMSFLWVEKLKPDDLY